MNKYAKEIDIELLQMIQGLISIHREERAMEFKQPFHQIETRLIPRIDIPDKPLVQIGK